MLKISSILPHNIILRGGPTSGWYSPPKGTHTGAEHRKVGSGKATADGKPVGKVETVPIEHGLGSSVTKVDGTPEPGANVSFLVTHEDGTRGIFKPADGTKIGWYESEIVAYQIDKSLGWGLVPETIETTLEGKVGSEQRWIEGGSSGMELEFDKGPDALRSDLRGVAMDYIRMTCLDDFISNPDRHNGNYLLDKSGKLWAIDNGASYIADKNEPFINQIFSPYDNAYMRRTGYISRDTGLSTGQVRVMRRSAYKEIVAWTRTDAYLDVVDKMSPHARKNLDISTRALRKYYGD